MFGNYPVNDDWAFFWQVKFFSQGITTISAIVDPTFLSQGFLGLLWSSLFGLNYLSLQILTFLISLATCFFTYKILLKLGIRKVFAFASALMLLVNPLFFSSAFTFMTDNYFLFFLAVSSYFFISYLQDRSNLKLLLLSCLFTFFLTATRQIGILLFLPYALALLGPSFKNPRKKFTKELILLVIFVLISILTMFLWPKFGTPKRFLDTKYIFDRLQMFLLIPQYFVIFLAPVFIGIKTHSTSIKKTLGTLLITSICGYILYKSDFFPLGNILYIEELYAKSDFRSNFSLFDNVITKLLLAILWGYSFSKVLLHLISKLPKKFLPIKINDTDVFLISAFLINLAILTVSTDMYDRYLLPSFFFLLLFVFSKVKESNFACTKSVYFYIFLLAIISFALQWEFSKKNNLMWQQVEKLRTETNLSKSIEFSDTYINHISVLESQDFTGLEPRKKSYDPVCFIQDYTVDSSSKVVSLLENLTNPKPSNVRKKTMPRIKNNLDKLMYNEEYSSIIYGAVSKKAYVGTFCVIDSD